MPARISPAASLAFPALSSGAITIASKWMTLSAFVHSPTRPASAKVLSSAARTALPSNTTVKRSPSACTAAVERDRKIEAEICND